MDEHLFLATCVNHNSKGVHVCLASSSLSSLRKETILDFKRSLNHKSYLVNSLFEAHTEV